MKNKLFYSILLVASLQFAFAQNKKSDAVAEEKSFDNIYMTWNKNTPESEMKDDIKALAEHGVTITYSDVTRNDKGEITAIKVNYTDKNGSTGSLALNSTKPINTIKIYKQNDEVGFGEPADSGFAFANGFNGDDFMERFKLGDKGMAGQYFNFNFPDSDAFGKTSSRIMIQKDGKKPLVLEDGKIIEGGEDYTLEEIEEIRKNNQPPILDNKDFIGFNFNEKGNFEDQLQKMQNQIDEMMSKQSFSKRDKSQLEDAKKEMEQAKKEMEQAKKEMENAKKELQKAKSSLKTQKA